jgi:hypothetical protein
MLMRRLITAAGRLRQARGLASMLDAACDVFEEILAAIGSYEESTDTLIVPFLLAATQAANGRDAVLFAPSLPPRALHPPQTAHGQQRPTAGDISAAVASLSRLLAAQLISTGAAAANAADRAACHDAAGHARQIHDLLANGGP